MGVAAGRGEIAAMPTRVGRHAACAVPSGPTQRNGAGGARGGSPTRAGHQRGSPGADRGKFSSPMFTAHSRNSAGKCAPARRMVTSRPWEIAQSARYGSPRKAPARMPIHRGRKRRSGVCRHHGADSAAEAALSRRAAPEAASGLTSGATPVFRKWPACPLRNPPAGALSGAFPRHLLELRRANPAHCAL